MIETLEAERDEVRERLAWLDGQIEAFKEDDERADPTGKPPARSKRRATAKRASRRRHAARDLRPDVKTLIVAFVEKNPQSTAGDVAKGLDLDRSEVAAKLTQLANAGELTKARRGYVVAD